jgi:filamentous hemagglutinin family protein
MFKQIFTATLVFFITTPVYAQIIPDNTVGSTVTRDVIIKDALGDSIKGGEIRGSNLFHSFQEFNINAGQRVYFANPDGVNNIFSRVTGSNPSNINGTLGVLGNANLYFLNPNGIIFGSNARLDLNGSFLATTAQSINFADGIKFETTNLQATPLLTVSIPVGVQFSNNPGKIQVKGSGHNYTGGFPTPSSGKPGIPQLQVSPGRTLALIGGEITFKSGVISGEGGEIELGGIGNQNQNPLVQFTSTNTGWKFNYSAIEKFAPINLTQKASVDGSGVNTSNIYLTGSKIDIADGSVVFIENRGSQPGGNITVKADEAVTIRGTSTDRTADSRLSTIARSTGNSGDISVETKRLAVQDFGDIYNFTYGRGNSGAINIKATDSIEMGGVPVFNPIQESGISALTFGLGNSGKVIISTGKLSLLPVSVISASTFGLGNGGQVTINANESIELIGKTANTTGTALINASTFGSGNAGSLQISTSRLLIKNGAAIGATNFGTGNGGTVIINASESIGLMGSREDASLGGKVPSQIGVSNRKPSAAFQQFFNLSSTPSGDSGNLKINTSQLSITDGAEVMLLNEGTGKGGTFIVNAEDILMDKGNIQAFTDSGKGGNVSFNLQNTLLLRNGSIINAEAGKDGDGGNITINSPLIIGLENSDITANANQGNGGNIKIRTQGIFGLQNRNQRTPKSDIVASSQFGVDGIVEINNSELDLNSGLSELPQEIINSNEQITTGCNSISENKLVASGRGGLPPSPMGALRSQTVWNDLRNVNVAKQNAENIQASDKVNNSQLIEADSWVIDANGQVNLVANNNRENSQAGASCLEKAGNM